MTTDIISMWETDIKKAEEGFTIEKHIKYNPLLKVSREEQMASSWSRASPDCGTRAKNPALHRNRS